MKNRIISLVLALIMLMSLAACGGKEPAETKAPAEKISFTDDIGREVEIPAEISRIAASGPLAQLILFAIAPDMFVGLADELNDSAKGIIEDKYFELPYFGSLYASVDLSVEELALAAPQLIIDIGEEKASAKEDMDALQTQTGIPTVFISSSLESMPETYRRLGKLLGREEKGEELASFCERVYERTVSIMEKVGDNKVNTLYVIGDKGLNVLAQGSYHAELLDMLTNNAAVVDNPISKGSGNEVSMEQISLWDPDFVIFSPDSIYDSVKEMSPWNKVSAIAEDKYVEVPDVPVNWMSMPPSVQRYLGLIWLTAELYPEYCDYDVKAEILEYYRLFYGCELTDAQYESITEKAFTE